MDSSVAVRTTALSSGLVVAQGPDKLRLRLELPDAASRLRTAKGLLTLLAKG